MAEKNYINIKGSNNITLQDISGSVINVNEIELVRTVINNSNKEYIQALLLELDKRAVDLRQCNEIAFANLLNLVKAHAKKQNIQVNNSQYVNLGDITDIKGDVIFGSKTINHYNTSSITDKQLKRDDFLNKLERRYKTLIKAKMNSELGFKLELKLRYTKKGTDEQFIKDYYIDNYKEAEIDNFNQLVSEFNNNLKRLLILGKPGSGKSVIVLQFALNLIKTARQNRDFPIPIIIDLATWNNEAKFETWLEENLIYITGKYLISKEYAKRIVSEGKTLLILDGFDEIKMDSRKFFIDALDEFLYKLNNNRQPEDKFPELIITSRIKEYRDIQINAPVHSSIEIQDLNNDYVISEITRLKSNQKGNAADVLLRENNKNPNIIKNLKTSFSVHIALKLVKQNNLSNLNSDNDIINDYITTQLKTNDFNEDDSISYLGFISSMLNKSGKGNRFELIDLQPNWLKNNKIFGLVYGVILGLFISFIGVSFLINYHHLIFGKVGFVVAGLIGLSLGMYSGLKACKFIKNNEILQFKKDVTIKQLFKQFTKILLWLFVVLMFGFFITIEIWLIRGLLSQFFPNTILAIMIWISVWGLLLTIMFISQNIVKDIIKHLFEEKTFPKIVNPYKRLFATFKIDFIIYSLIFFLVFSLYSFPVFFLSTNLAKPVLNLSIMENAIFAIVMAFIFSLFTSSFIKHFILRLLLAVKGNLPINLAQFLTNMSKIGILIQDGGQWRFHHQLIKDKLNEMNNKKC